VDVAQVKLRHGTLRLGRFGGRGAVWGMPVVKGATEVALRIGQGPHVFRRSHGAARNRGFGLGIASGAKDSVSIKCAVAGEVEVFV